ncbi:MAG: hypothetical protein HRT37_25310 [Alteromonadaceae bacterium]|nr:hypothetical protein [Alteromonadaceae bacterium]
MENYQISVEITDKMLGDSNEIILTTGNSFALNFEDNEGKVLEVCSFNVENSHRIEFDEITGKALNSNMLIASPVGGSKRITEVFFGYSELVANLVLFERNTVLKTNVKPYNSVLCDIKNQTKDDDNDRLLSQTNLRIKSLFNKHS